MRVDRVYINTHRYDYELTKVCAGSVRYWYPDIPISLIVDHSSGKFVDTSLLQSWNIDILDTNGRKYGWGFGKFEPLFLPRHSFLILDADTVLAGRVIEFVEGVDADFIVDNEDAPWEKVTSLYYDPKVVEEKFPGFRYPGYMFNTGQWFGTSGIIAKEDFSRFVHWGERPRLLYPSVFKQAEQGLFNMILHEADQQGRIKLSRQPIMLWPSGNKGDFIQMDLLCDKDKGYPLIIHWAGMKFAALADFPRGDIMEFYLQYFESGLTHVQRVKEEVIKKYLPYEKRLKNRLRKIFY